MIRSLQHMPTVETASETTRQVISNCNHWSACLACSSQPFSLCSSLLLPCCVRQTTTPPAAATAAGSHIISIDHVLCVPWFVDKLRTKGSRSYLRVHRLGCVSRLVEWYLVERLLLNASEHKGAFEFAQNWSTIRASYRKQTSQSSQLCNDENM